MGVSEVSQTQDKASQQENLLKKMGAAKNQKGQPLFTTASVLGLMLFFMIALQCLSTTSIATREVGLRFALFQLIIFNVAAYILTVAFVQGLHRIGIA